MSPCRHFGHASWEVVVIQSTVKIGWSGRLTERKAHRALWCAVPVGRHTKYAFLTKNIFTSPFSCPVRYWSCPNLCQGEWHTAGISPWRRSVSTKKSTCVHCSRLRRFNPSPNPSVNSSPFSVVDTVKYLEFGRSSKLNWQLYSRYNTPVTIFCIISGVLWGADRGIMLYLGKAPWGPTLNTKVSFMLNIKICFIDH
jgi:hypothetical protein